MSYHTVNTSKKPSLETRDSDDDPFAEAWHKQRFRPPFREFGKLSCPPVAVSAGPTAPASVSAPTVEASKHAVNINKLSRAQLKQLANDVAYHLDQREQDDRAALEAKLRSIVEEHGFDPATLRLEEDGKRCGVRS